MDGQVDRLGERRVRRSRGSVEVAAEPSERRAVATPEVLARRACAVVVAAVAAYASYEHQRTFAVRGGADPVGASLWPLSVDGLLVLSTI